jgi:hypothetical protein
VENQSDPASSASITVATWDDLVIENQQELRPFLVTTADTQSAINGMVWSENRIEAEELWIVHAVNREDAISRVGSSLKPNIVCVDAFDVPELHALARATETLLVSKEKSLVKILTPWCAEVAFGE